MREQTLHNSHGLDIREKNTHSKRFHKSSAPSSSRTRWLYLSGKHDAVPESGPTKQTKHPLDFPRVE
ncbi:hypothetical protein Y1Q_0009544 [Alligator mississippiensis]|uniref:Uncharacterized protein n=1 Tax=Alligator mississippiensis TaxID=8496 RepID=A0A151NUA5_ALLMI|nr:hypothetical protein Y1Q_0009544 [Alligator mississippiensis]